MGHSLHQLRRANGAPHPSIRVRALPRRLAAVGHRRVSPGGEAAGPGDRGVTGEEAATGLVHASG